MRLPERIEAVVFDMDGTLLDTERLYRTAMFDVCESMGVQMTDALHLSLIGAPPDLGRMRLKAAFGQDFETDLYAHHVHEALEAVSLAGVPLKAGALEILGFLKGRGIATGLATSTVRDAALPRLDRAGLLSLLDVVITRTDVTHGKPHPESYLAAATALKAEPVMCVAVEDSHTGVRSAAASGMATVLAPDLLAATDEIAALCVGVVSGLDVLHARLAQHLDR